MKTVEIPLLFGSPRDKALFTARDYIKSTKAAKVKLDIAIIFFSKEIAEETAKKYKIKVGMFNTENPSVQLVKIGKAKVLFTKSVIGSPAAVTMIEEIISMGAKKIIAIGSAGALQDRTVGDIILPTRAIRDEGTSYHYLRPGKYTRPTKKLLQKIENVLKNEKISYTKGTTWTTDCPYRETFRKINKYKKEGVETVEMEASALFAIGKARKVQVASIFWISDQIGKKKWEHSFFTEHYKTGAKKAFAILQKYLEKETK